MAFVRLVGWAKSPAAADDMCAGLARFRLRSPAIGIDAQAKSRKIVTQASQFEQASLPTLPMNQCSSAVIGQQLEQDRMLHLAIQDDDGLDAGVEGIEACLYLRDHAA